MPKIAFLGAGSTVFARALLRDLFTFPELRDVAISLMDIDANRLRDSERMAHRVAEMADARPAIEATTDRRRALDGADYAINMIQVGGYQPSTVVDFEVPKRYGLRQTIGDTVGVGGIMRALRTIPVMLEMGRDMEALCPDVLFINYTNPMAILTWAMNRATAIKTVGLCHSVQGTAAYLARLLDIPPKEVTYLCAGINHLAFYLRLERGGQDLYPALRRAMTEGRVPKQDSVRFEMFRRLGYFVTESSEHFAEYVPYFIRRDRPDLVERFHIPLDEYPDRCLRQIAEWEQMRLALQDRDPQALVRQEKARREERLQRVAKKDPLYAQLLQKAWQETPIDGKVRHSGEYGTLLIHAVETNQPRVIYGNVMNEGLIENLPEGCCVEVPCLVDGNGVQPTRLGKLPPHLAGLMRTHINVQELTVKAALERRRDDVYYAAMLDPHTSAELTLDEITALVDDLIAAHGAYIPPFGG
jgi:alpha-galactosidase